MAEGMVEDTQEPSHLASSTSSSHVLISSFALLNSSLVMWILVGSFSQELSRASLQQTEARLRVRRARERRGPGPAIPGQLLARLAATSLLADNPILLWQVRLTD